VTPLTIEPVIDLAEIRAACRPLLHAYERICNGSTPSACLGELDEAICRLKALPRFSGRVGAAISLLVTGGRGPEATVGAFEVLSSFSTLHPGAVKREETNRAGQLTLFD
jgi:hypothetical protein